MKFIIFFLLCGHIKATSSLLLKCLAQEEASMHKTKEIGPFYLLNQDILNYLSQNSITLFQKYCPPQPSLVLLKSQMLKEKHQHIFIKIFFNFLKNLKGLVKDPHCFEKELPEIDQMMMKMLYLGTDYSIQNSIKDIRNIEIIFKKIFNVKELIKRCNQPQNNVSSPHLLK